MRIPQCLHPSLSSGYREEINRATHKICHNSYARFSSVKGRKSSLLCAGSHSIQIVSKTIIYSFIFFKNFRSLQVISVKCLLNKNPNLQSALLKQRNDKFKQTKKLALLIIVAPAAETISAAKAFAGVIDPRAYFKKAPPFILPIRFKIIEYKGSPQRTLMVTCDFYLPRTHPFETLHALAEQIKVHRVTDIHITYKGHAGSDGGGIRRDFLHRLTREISTGLNIKDDLPVWSQESETQLKDLGCFFKFLLNGVTAKSQSEYRIGHKFHPDLYKGIFCFTYEDLEKDFHQLSYLNLVNVLLGLTSVKEEDKLSRSMTDIFKERYLNNLREFLLTPDDEILFKSNLVTDLYTDYLSLTLESCPPLLNEDNSLNLKNLQHAKTLFCKAYIDSYLPQLHALHTIAKGMELQKDRSLQLQAIDSVQIITHIQGFFTKESFLKTLRFSNLSNEKIELIKNWANGLTIEEISDFLANTTGSPGAPRYFIFNGIETGIGSAHTCTYTLDLASSLTESGLLTTLNEYCVKESEGFFVL